MGYKSKYDSLINSNEAFQNAIRETSPKLDRLSLVLLFILIYASLFGQQACPINVAEEPTVTEQVRSNLNLDVIPFPFFTAWEGLNSTNQSDDAYATVSLAGLKRAQLIKISSLGLNIPSGAQINGIEITFEGRSEGDGIVEEADFRLLTNNIPTGESRANSGGHLSWSQDSLDQTWTYGSDSDLWGNTWTADQLNNPDFGFQFQLRNKGAQPLDIGIDAISVKITYTPLYTICDHTCVTFFVDSLDVDNLSYNWTWSQGFKMLSFSEHAGYINLGVDYATFGNYEVCVETLEDDIITETCCREFNFIDCNPGAIGDFVWDDINANAIFDPEDSPLPGVQIDLYNTAGAFVSSTISNDQGFYNFEGVTAGQYYIEVQTPDDYVPVFSNIGLDDNTDSDITGANGPNTSDVIDLASGQFITNIDIGLSKLATVGDLAWEDTNGNGLLDPNEPGLSGINVILESALGPIYTTTTDGEGLYSIGPVPLGMYTMTFEVPSGYVTTGQLVGDSIDIDSNINEDGQSQIFVLTEGGAINHIDAGFYKLAQLGDFVWLDEDFNGLQDDGEPGIADVTLSIFNEQGELTGSTVTDSTGAYSFMVPPGTYSIEATNTLSYIPTQQVGGEPAQDSDISNLGGSFISPAVTLTSGQVNNDFDFGFIDEPSTIGGFLWLDSNSNGIYDDPEVFLSNVSVSLYNTNGTLINTVMSGESGDYSFVDISGGQYYITYEVADTLVSTLSNIGDDGLDSDVTNEIAPNSTDTIIVVPGVNDFTIWGGFGVKPNIGDKVWVDLNRNGLQDDGEPGAPAILVSLFDILGEMVAETITDLNGIYEFQNITPGDYTVRFAVDNFFTFTEANTGDSNLDSDADSILPQTETTVEAETNPFSVSINQSIDSIDAGILLPFGGVTGKIFVDKDENGRYDLEAPLENILVRLFDNEDNLVEETKTDSLGIYTFLDVMMGSYYVTFEIADRYDFTEPDVAEDNIDSDVTGSIVKGSTDLFEVVDGIFTINIDAGLLDGISKIAGSAWLDDNGNGIIDNQEPLLSGISIKLYSNDSTVVDSAITSEEGSYSFANIDTGFYFVTFDNPDSSYFNTNNDVGDDELIDDDVTGFFSVGSTDSINVQYFEKYEGVNAGYYQLASVGDQAFIDENENGIRDTEDPGINDIIVNLLNEEGETIKSTVTAPGGGQDSGYYLLTDVPPGLYQLEFVRVLYYAFIEGDQGTDTTDSDVILIEENRGYTDFFSLASGSIDTTQDVGFIFSIPFESSISGTVWEDNDANALNDSAEPVREGLTMELYNEAGVLQGTTVTDPNGNYTFDMLAEGFYYVQTILPVGEVAAIPFVGDDASIDSDFLSSNDTTTTEVFFLAVVEDINDIDLGISKSLTVGDFVWNDFNLDGIQDTDELGVANIPVTITSMIGSFSKSTETDDSGFYTFSDLPSGMYQFTFTKPTSSFFTLQNIGDESTDSDTDAEGQTDIIDLTGGGIVDFIDAGIQQAGSINGKVFIDFNGNGVQNFGEPGEIGLYVKLYDENGMLIDSTNSVEGEMSTATYSFNNVMPGNYYVEFEILEDHIITEPNKGDDTTDSDITSMFSFGSTDLIFVGSGEELTNVDGGMYMPSELGGQVWNDDNMNGILEAGELGVAEIEVVLYRSFGLAIDTTFTDEEGRFNFDNLKQGLYFVEYKIPDTYTISPQNVSGDEATDSDADQSGVTDLVSISHGFTFTDSGCGIFLSLATLRSVVWEDTNADGMRQSDEDRLSDIKINLLDENGTIIDSSATNHFGKYSFSNLQQGNYYVEVKLEGTDYIVSSPNMGGDDMVDSDVMEDGVSEMFNVGESLSVPNIDIGLHTNTMFIAIENNGSPLTKTDDYFDVTVGPNPALYFIEATDKDPIKNLGSYQIILTDRNGQTLYTTSTDQLINYRVNMEALHSGTYYLTVVSDRGIVTKKILKITN